MRKHKLGAKPPPRGWYKDFVAPRRREKAVSKPREQRPGPPPRNKVMLRFVTLKGGRRSEPLRHYFHEMMAYLLDADPNVLRWVAEPVALEVEHDDGVEREFLYDIRAETRDGLRLIKLVDDTWGERPGKRSRKPRAPRPVSAPGVAVEFWTRSQLDDHPLLGPSQEFHYHRPRESEPSLRFRLGGLAAQRPFTTLGEVHERLGTDEVAWEDVLSLVARGFIEVDMTDSRGPGMRVLSCSSSGHEE